MPECSEKNMSEGLYEGLPACNLRYYCDPRSRCEEL